MASADRGEQSNDAFKRTRRPMGGTFGSVIDDQFRGGNNWPLGSAMAVLLLVLVVFVLVVRGRRGEDVL